MPTLRAEGSLKDGDRIEVMVYPGLLSSTWTVSYQSTAMQEPKLVLGLRYEDAQHLCDKLLTLVGEEV